MATHTVSQYSSEDLRFARKSGFKRKKPKQPSRKTYDAMASYIVRYNEWVKDLKTAATKGRAMDTMRSQLAKAK